MATPDHVPCRHCGQPISWDEICWTHDVTGFADCDLKVYGTAVKYGESGKMIMVIDPELKVEGPNAGKTALPIGEWS